MSQSHSGLTTAEIAALIALGIFIVQIFFSFTFTIVLVALLQERETAVTWSVVSRILHRSYWPTVLRTDAVASNGVRGPINMLSWVILSTTVLVAVAAIVTPLGLYETVTLNDPPVLVPFQYLVDSSPFGNGTSPPSSYGPSRYCVNGDLVCPNSANTDYIITYFNYTWNEQTTLLRKDNLTSYDLRIPRKYVEFLGSGTSRLGLGVSSPFDIQYRTWEETKAKPNSIQSMFNNSRPYARGYFRQVGTLLLNNKWDIVAGLIVDTKSGGVGFRNHTAPAGDLPYGATWTEDILFVEPVTECVDLGITFEFDRTQTATTANLSMVDQGGFININRSAPRMVDGDLQQDPRLTDRAYTAGWSWRFLQMLVWNITDRRSQPISGADPLFTYLESHIGKVVKLPSRPDGTSYESWAVPDKVSMTNFDSNLLFYLPSRPYGNFTTGPLFNSSGYLNLPLNPFTVYTDDFMSIDRICSGLGAGKTADPRNVVGKCGLIYGMAKTRPDVGYSIPMHSCASANRAVIKTVKFSFNTSESLDGLSIDNIEPKKYSDSSEYPLWAFESSAESDDPQWNLRSWNPLWGIVEKEDPAFANLSYKRSPELWLTGSTDDADLSFAAYNLAAITVPKSLLYHAYKVYSGPLTTAVADFLADYSGKVNIELHNMWKDLTKTPKGIERMINLVWTDIAANAFYGSRGLLPVPLPPNLAKRSEGNKRSGLETEFPVYVRVRRTRYRYIYAIPAFIVLGIVVATLFGSLVTLILGRGTVGRTRLYLARLSSGRVMTAFLAKEELVEDEDGTVAGSVSTSRWLEKDGRIMVDVSRRRPYLLGLEGENEAGTTLLESGK